MDYLKPHRRFNPLTGEWVLVSPHRALRPWQGKMESLPMENLPAYDPKCYLCPGNERAGGVKNPDYAGAFVFDNDFPALLTDSVLEEKNEFAWKRAKGDAGICRVLCYSPRHDLTLGELDLKAMRAVVDMWVGQVDELMSLQQIGYVQVFENKGEMMGCSNPHPHGQIWATRETPNEPAKEDLMQSNYLKEHGCCLLCDVLKTETTSGERVVMENVEWLVLVPFWAVWPFETLVLPKRHAGSLLTLDEPQKDALAEIWQKLIKCYDRLFGVKMPFSCGFHIAPKQSINPSAWHMHAHFYPPLLRSATVKKFMVGYELLCSPQRDLTPEQAAERLRGLA